MPTVLVSGLGLMGGSLAAAATSAGWTVLLHHRRRDVAIEAQRLGYGRAVTDYTQAADAELAVVCAPVSAIAGVAEAIAAATRAVVTDVGSTKAGICARLAHLGPRFVGSHPMCGSHLQGLAHADPLLYHGATVIVTAPDALVERLWRDVGGRVLHLDPASHDAAVAAASHVPHVLAAAAAAGLDAAAAPVAASGFRDTTRVAAGDAELWSDILLDNATAVGAGIAAAQQRLAALADALERGDRATVTAWLAEGRAGRARFEAAGRCPS